MVGHHDAQGPAIEQLSIALLGGHDQHLLEGQTPVQAEVTNGLGLGGPKRQHVEEPMVEDMGPGVEAEMAQPLPHHLQHPLLRKLQRVAELEGTLVGVGLWHQAGLQIRQGLLHR